MKSIVKTNDTFVPKGLLWSMVNTWGSAGMRFVVFLILARILLPIDFGLMALSIVFIEGLGLLSQGGFSAEIVQRQELEQEHLSTAFWMVVAAALILGGSIIVAAPWLASLFDQPLLDEIVSWLVPGMVLHSLNHVHGAILQRKMQFRLLAIRTFAASVFGGVCGIAAALADMGVWSLVIMYVANSGMSVIVLWGVTTWRPSLRFSLGHFMDLADWGVSWSLPPWDSSRSAHVCPGS